MTVTENVVKNQLTVGKCLIKKNGAAVASDLMDDLIAVEVNQTVLQPTMFVMRFFDVELKRFSSGFFAVGDEYEISMGQGNSAVKLLEGEVTGFELDYHSLDSLPVLTVRGYDKMHRLHRGRKTRTFLKVSDSDLVSKLAKEGGLSANASASNVVYDYILQNNETNFEFLHRRASRIGMELYVEDKKLILRKVATPDAESATVKWGEDLLSFNTRLNTMEQVDEVMVRGWDIKKKEAVVGTASTSPTKFAKVGEAKTGKQMASSFGATKLASVFRPVTNQTEATSAAQAIFDDIASRYVQIEGSCIGNSAINPGKFLKIQNIGTKYSGKYYITSCTHHYNKGEYLTTFEANGRQTNSIVELTGQAQAMSEKYYGMVVGVVTNIKDPDEIGRIKVKFPWLPQNEGKDIESNWARISSPMAGNDRGFFYLPEVNDEVLVAFEHGDVNLPYVIGFLWNGKDKPPEKASSIVTADGKNTIRTIKTRTGHILRFNDSDDAPKIEIIDKTTKNKITVDSKVNKITIESDKDIDIVAKKGKVLIDAQNIEMKATQNIKSAATQNIEMEATANFNAKGTGGVKVETPAVAEVKALGSLTLEGTGSAALKGTNVDINGTAKASVNGGVLLEAKGGVVKIN